MLNKSSFSCLILSVGLLITPAVQAHSLLANETSWLAGIVHPWQGMDHLLAMLAIGLWAAQQGGSRIWQLPLTFISMLMAGVVVGQNGYVLPFIESGIASSLLIVGLLLAFAIRLTVIPSVLMVGLFALFHGYAHGTDLTQTTTMIYVYGLVFSSCVIQVLGIAIGLLSQYRLKQNILRLGGLAIGFTGVWLWI